MVVYLLIRTYSILFCYAGVDHHFLFLFLFFVCARICLCVCLVTSYVLVLNLFSQALIHEMLHDEILQRIFQNKHNTV